MLKTFTFFMLLTLLYLSGCGADEDEVEVAPVIFLSASPPSGSEINLVNGSITLLFDGTPRNITTNIGEVRVTNRIVTITELPWSPSGKQELIVTWADRTQKLLYTLTAPCADPEVACQ